MRTYITNLLNDAGISNLDEELREEMIKEVYERLDQYITSVIVEHMQPEHVDEFIRMNEEKKTSRRSSKISS
jgi:ABC-type Fe3+/spermidine/putrescine transport system ATPase subunit